MTHNYRIPDYYPEFLCKCGECRHPCCIGWGISLKMEEYFRLLGLECSPALRRRLDSAFHLAENPSPERYALITPNWAGDCPMRREDGLCALQKECGEDVLTSTCRYYPRSPKFRFGHTCSCSNSCEAVLELLFDRDEPLRFLEKELTFAMPDEESDLEEETIARANLLQQMCITVLQNRRYPLNVRIFLLVKSLNALSPLWKTMPLDALQQMTADIAACREEIVLPAADPADSLRIQTELTEWFIANSRSIEAYGEEALAALHITDQDRNWPEISQTYAAAAEHLNRSFPRLEIMLEQALVNHIFHESYPFSEMDEPLSHAGIAICCGYSLIRLLTVGYMQGREALSGLVDVMAAAFRLIDHTRFDHNAVIVLHELGGTEITQLAGLLAQ